MTAPGEVSVSYQYGQTSGSVAAGTTKTIFAPAGTSIMVTANPSSIIYSFNGWAGATNSSGGTASVVLNSPSSLRANYGISFEILAGGLGAVVLVVAIVAIMVVRRRHLSVVSLPTTTPSAGQGLGPGISPPPALPKAAGPQLQDLLCPTCHNPIVRGEPFCPTCGTKLGSGQNFCRKCGHPVSPQALFCNQCGNRLS